MFAIFQSTTVNFFKGRKTSEELTLPFKSICGLLAYDKNSLS